MHRLDGRRLCEGDVHRELVSTASITTKCKEKLLFLISIVRKPLLPTLCAAISILPNNAGATWSIVAADTLTKQVAIATATCVPQSLFAGSPFEGLMDVQGIVAPDAGAAAAQAVSDPTGHDQGFIQGELEKGISPRSILNMILATDKRIQTRQFGIVDVHGRSAAFSGDAIPGFALSRRGWTDHRRIAYSMQGNTLRSKAVITNGIHAFEAAKGSLSDRALAALEAGDAAGGDRRCSCETAPHPKGPCTKRHALIAYLLVADPHDRSRIRQENGKTNRERKYRRFIYVTDENTRPGESADPVQTLRRRYEALREKPYGAQH